MNSVDTFRDCQWWNNEKLPLSTCSNEAAKLFDAGLHQYVGWYEDERLGGLAGTCQKMLQADPTFIMGKVFTYGLDLIGTGRSTRIDKVFEKQLLDLQTECQKRKVTDDRERLHVDAVVSFADGNLYEAIKHWENILVDYPTDVLALKFAHDTYFYLGDAVNVRDSIARVLPNWKKTSPLYGYIKGMFSFGLEETNLFKEAEATANEALGFNKNDAWAVHTLAHIHEMYGTNDQGINLLNTLEPDWKCCGLLACHLYWHWCLYATEKGDYDMVLKLFDQEINNRCKKSGAMLDIVDTASLLYRLQMEGVNVEDRWRDITEVCTPHLDDHILSFNDAHFIMSFLGSKKSDLVEKMLGSMETFVRENVCDSSEITKDVGFKLCLALVDYSNKNYPDVVDSLYPIRNKIVKIGGSHAQRDVFNQLLIHACLKSPNQKHNRLARSLLYERKALKPNSPLTDRLMARLLSCHVE